MEDTADAPTTAQEMFRHPGAIRRRGGVPSDSYPVAIQRTHRSIARRALPLGGHRKLNGAARKRGKRLLIWRDRALLLASGGTIPAPRGESIELTDVEINTAFATTGPSHGWPLLLSPDTLANALSIGRSSIYRWLAFRYLNGAYVRRSDGIRFVRNAIIKTLFNGAVWQ